MNKYLQAFHSFFNLCCNILDNKSLVSYTVNHQEVIAAQQLDYLTINDQGAICDVALYI